MVLRRAVQLGPPSPLARPPTSRPPLGASTDEHEVNATYILLNDQSSIEIETERLSDLVVAKKLTQTDGEVQRLTQCVSTLIETLQDGCAKMH
jgi:hypothetical protein